jgi:ABC-type Fe3+/spermidine/putrescine transport system ATPase subunit
MPEPAVPPGLALDLVGVSKRYGRVTALEDVTLRVAPGEFVTLLGPSGCGKTTLLKAVAGFLSGVEGEIRLGGRRLAGVPPHRRQIGIVFQHYALFPHYTVAQNVGFGLKMRRAPRAAIRDRVAEMLRLVQLEGYEARYPRELSGGQQQRVALARVLAIQPHLLLLDEPFGALDRKLRVQMQVELKQLQQRLGITTVFVTHDQEEALTMSDRIAVMRLGRVVQCASPPDIYDHPASPYVADFIGVTNLIPGRVVEGKRPARVDLLGVPFSLPQEAPGPPGAAVLVAVRPEALGLRRGVEGGERGWAGRLTFAIHAGPRVDYEVTLDDGFRLRVTSARDPASGGAAWPVGSPVRVTIANPSACRLFPAGPPEASGESPGVQACASPRC